MSGEPIFTATQPDGTTSVVDLSTPGAYQDFAFEAAHADGRRDRFAAYHTGERAIFIDVLTRLAASRSAETVLADITRIRDAVTTSADGLSPTSSRLTIRATWPIIPVTPVIQFSNSYSVDGRGRGVGLTVAGDKYGLRFSERRGRSQGLKVVIPTAELWRFAAGMMWRSYEDRGSLMLSRVTTDEYQDAVDCFQAHVRATPMP